MPAPIHGKRLAEALTALCGPGLSVTELVTDQASHPGLYAFHTSASTWRELGLGNPPDDRPLYVGKAENTLASRDIEGHFGMRKRGAQSPTGSSTLRRSLAALLAPTRGYHGIPRNPAKPGDFSNFGLSVAHDDDLSAWMCRRLHLALWPHPAPAQLDAIETDVLRELSPPVNLAKVVTVTPWRYHRVKGARKELAAEARVWRSGA